MSSLWLATTWALLINRHTVDVTAPVSGENRTIRDAAEEEYGPPADLDLRPWNPIVPVRIDARNQMGRRFRLIEARFELGGQELAHMTALPGQEVDLNSRPMQSFLVRGEYALTAVFIYQGQNVGLFSYLDGYRYRLEKTYWFHLEPGRSYPVIEVVARERGGITVSLEKRPTMTIFSQPGHGVLPIIGI